MISIFLRVEDIEDILCSDQSLIALPPPSSASDLLFLVSGNSDDGNHSQQIADEQLSWEIHSDNSRES